MTRTFSLAGLLRLRRIREDQAAGALAAANAKARETQVRSAQVRGALTQTTADVTNVAALNAVQTARASARSMLSELDALSELRASAAEKAAADFAAARSQSFRIEKLESRHAALEAEEDLRAEQGALDEIGSRSWFAAKDEATA